MKRIALVLTFAFLLSIPAISEAANPVAGAKCSKVGTIQTYQNKKFTCVKSGKKLVWNKGTSIQIANPAPTPTPAEVKPISKVGDTCNKFGEEVKAAELNLICLYIKGKKLQYFESGYATEVSRLSTNASNLDLCKLKDVRSNKFSGGGSTGFPFNQNVIKNNGVVKVAVLGFNFPGSPAVTQPSDYFKKYTDQLDQRMKYLYGDAIKYEWTYLPEWLMTEKTAEYYAADHSTYSANGLQSDGVKQVMSSEEISNYFFSLAETKLILKNYDFYFILTNPLEAKVPQGPFARSATIKTATQTYSNMNYYALGYRVLTSNWQDPRLLNLSDIVGHEIAHYQGLVQHAPGNGWGWYIGNNPAWEALLAGWRPDSDYVCFDATSNMKEATVSMASLDLNNTGFKAAIIKVSDSKAIVIESRRKGPYTSALPQNLAGIVAYVINTAIDAQRYDGDVSKEELYYAYFLRVKSSSYLVPKYENLPIWDENILAFQGDYFEYEGIKIELTQSGKFDSIRISK